MEAQAFLFPPEELIFSPEAAPARTSPSPGSGGASPTAPDPLSHSSMLDWWESYVPAFSSGRTSLACYPVAEDGTLPPYFAGWTSWGMGSPGGFWTCNGPEWTAPCRAEDGGASPAPFPNGESVSGLSDLLEPPEQVPPKYYLSATACRGILRRAEKREKDLPPLLDIALRSQLKRAEAREKRNGGGWSVGNGQLNSAEPETVCKTLDAMNDPQKIVRELSAPTTGAGSAGRAPRDGSSPSRSASFDGTDCAPTLHRPNGGPGAGDQEIFLQGGATSPACGREVVTMAKELYNAGERQAGGLGIGTDGAAPCLRADDHPAAVALRRGGVCRV